MITVTIKQNVVFHKEAGHVKSDCKCRYVENNALVALILIANSRVAFVELSASERPPKVRAL